MCMDICTIHKTGSKIGEVKDITINAIGDCFSEYVWVRISIDMMKHLKKILRIQQEDGKEIPFEAVYEKLQDFCFCCCYIEHQYRERAIYKGWTKEELAYMA